MNHAQQNKHLFQWRIRWSPSERGTLDSFAAASPEPPQAFQTVATSQRYPSTSSEVWRMGGAGCLNKQLMRERVSPASFVQLFTMVTVQ